MQSPRTFLTAFTVLAAVLLAGCANGSDDASSAATGNPVDRAFVAQMVAHHQSAVAMAKIAERRGSSAFVTSLADDIVRTQTAEISTMRSADRRLQRAGLTRGSLGVPEHMTGMDGDVASLDRAAPFDPAFIRMMLPHHQGAVAMARAELRKGADETLKTLARNIIATQQREIRQMRKHLGSAPPAGTTTMHGAGHSG